MTRGRRAQRLEVHRLGVVLAVVPLDPRPVEVAAEHVHDAVIGGREREELVVVVATLDVFPEFRGEIVGDGHRPPRTVLGVPRLDDDLHGVRVEEDIADPQGAKFVLTEAGLHGRPVHELPIARVPRRELVGILTEHRVGGRPYPFRCPKPIYDAMAEVLAGADHALSLEEMITAVTAVTGDPPADYQVRVPLRLWMHVEPPLIVRNRA